jgi:hypothetical protein
MKNEQMKHQKITVATCIKLCNIQKIMLQHCGVPNAAWSGEKKMKLLAAHRCSCRLAAEASLTMSATPPRVPPPISATHS